jgi:putative transposase
MSRFRLLPTPEQEQELLGHCRDARFVWNLAVEQQQHWQPGRRAPGYGEDFAQVMRNFFTGTHRRPSWRKAGVHEGFRQVGVKPRHVERLNRRLGRVWVPKVGWVRFRLSRPVPEGVKSYRVARDRAGRWHVAFAHVPDPIAGPGDCSVVGIDRGVAVSAALSTGEMLHAPSVTRGVSKRLKASGRVEKVRAAHTSQRCSACGHVAPGNRKSQAVFECEACTAGRSANREPQLSTSAV